MSCVPTGASACSFAAAAPVAIQDGAVGGIVSPPPTPTAVTAPSRSAFGSAAGKEANVTSAEPATRGTATP